MGGRHVRLSRREQSSARRVRNTRSEIGYAALALRIELRSCRRLVIVDTAATVFRSEIATI